MSALTLWELLSYVVTVVFVDLFSAPPWVA
jgi:hypothetical protein